MFAMKLAAPIRAVTIAAAMTALTVSAQAQQPSAATIAMANELIELKGAAGLFNPIVPGVIEQAKNVFVQTSPNLARELNEVAAKLRNDYAKRTEELRKKVALLYATQFSDAELRQVLAFYKTPLGRKVIDQEPKILDQSMRDAQAWANALSEEILGKFREEMKKRGHDI